MQKKWHLAGILLTTAFVTSDVGACSLAAEAYNLDAFLASTDTHKVVFRGRVQSIESTFSPKEHLPMQKIRFKVEHWWRGQNRDIVDAIGTVGNLQGTDCEGVFDFKVELDEEWLIVGYEEAGIVDPSRLLSKRLVNHVLPPEARRALKVNN
jgi:hypothetical protein